MNSYSLPCSRLTHCSPHLHPYFLLPWSVPSLQCARSVWCECSWLLVCGCMRRVWFHVARSLLAKAHWGVSSDTLQVPSLSCAENCLRGLHREKLCELCDLQEKRGPRQQKFPTWRLFLQICAVGPHSRRCNLFPSQGFALPDLSGFYCCCPFVCFASMMMCL